MPNTFTWWLLHFILLLSIPFLSFCAGWSKSWPRAYQADAYTTELNPQSLLLLTMYSSSCCSASSLALTANILILTILLYIVVSPGSMNFMLLWLRFFCVYWSFRYFYKTLVQLACSFLYWVEVRSLLTSKKTSCVLDVSLLFYYKYIFFYNFSFTFSLVSVVKYS